MKIKLFLDGANLSEMKEMSNDISIGGLTTNPTLMHKSGVIDYRNFCKQVLQFEKTKPISFEVFADEMEEIKNQALEIKTWGTNVFVKIPVMNTKGECAYDLISYLTDLGVQLNITAVMTKEQVKEISKALNHKIPSFVSIFAGRIADTGRDPCETIKSSLEILKDNNNAEIIWASTRELYNIIQADKLGCHIITIPKDIYKKINLLNKNLDEFTIETVKMFRNDALKAGYSL
jgi:transaldolase